MYLDLYKILNQKYNSDAIASVRLKLQCHSWPITLLKNEIEIIYLKNGYIVLIPLKDSHFDSDVLKDQFELFGGLLHLTSEPLIFTQYLCWSAIKSQVFLLEKKWFANLLCTIRTLTRRAQLVCDSPDSLTDEIKYLDNVFTKNNYSKDFSRHNTYRNSELDAKNTTRHLSLLQSYLTSKGLLKLSHESLTTLQHPRCSQTYRYFTTATDER